MAGLGFEGAPPEGHDGHSDMVLNGLEGIVRLTAGGVEVVAPHGTLLEVSYSGLRRIQLDIEQDRPATFVLVPHNANHRPQVLSIPADEYGAAGKAIAIIGQRLARLDGRSQG